MMDDAKLGSRGNDMQPLPELNREEQCGEGHGAVQDLLAAARRMVWIVRKELLVLFCNRTSRMMLIVPPLMQIVIFGWAATLEVRNVTFGVLDRDGGAWSSEVSRSILAASPFVRMVRLADERQMRKDMENERILFAVVFRQDFSRRIEAGLPTTCQLIMDGRRANASQVAGQYVSSIVSSVSEKTPRWKAMQAKGAATAPIVDVRAWFNPNLEFRWFYLPNLIGMISFILGIVVAALSVAREREAGTFDQLIVAPASPTEIAFAKLVPGCIIGAVHGTLFLVIATMGFGVPFRGSILLLYAAMIVFSLAGNGIGLMISSIAQTQQQAFLGGFTVAIPVVLISGSVTPVVNMPPFLQAVSQLSPLTHFFVICHGCFLRDILLDDALVCLGKIALICVVCLMVSVAFFKRRT